MSVISQNNEYAKSLPAMLLHTRKIYCQTSKTKKNANYLLADLNFFVNARKTQFFRALIFRTK